MGSSINEKLAKLRERKSELQHKERILLERARRHNHRKLAEVGKLAEKANIHDLDPDTLFGAFLEIAELLEQQEKRDEWKRRGGGSQQLDNEEAARLIVRFDISPTSSEKALLRQGGFRWNSFRGEYYGRGDQDRLAELLPSNCTIEAI